MTSGTTLNVTVFKNLDLIPFGDSAKTRVPAEMPIVIILFEGRKIPSIGISGEGRHRRVDCTFIHKEGSEQQIKGIFENEMLQIGAKAGADPRMAELMKNGTFALDFRESTYQPGSLRSASVVYVPHIPFKKNTDRGVIEAVMSVGEKIRAAVEPAEIKRIGLASTEQELI
jgi:hypothetical protein